MVGDVAQPAGKDAAARGLSRRRLYRDPARRWEECAVQKDEVRRGAPHNMRRPRARGCEYISDLILRSLRSKRLEGWTQRMDSRPSFETRLAPLLRMRSEIYFTTSFAGDDGWWYCAFVLCDKFNFQRATAVQL